MPFAHHPALTQVAVRGGANPLSIMGAALVGWWTADRDDLITQSGGLVSSWKDVIGAYDLVQSSGTLKPVYSATSFGGRPGVSFDGVDDYLRRVGTPATFPTSNNYSEIWYIGSQDALAADTTSRYVAAYGGTGSNSDSRSIDRKSVV